MPQGLAAVPYVAVLIISPILRPLFCSKRSCPLRVLLLSSIWSSTPVFLQQEQLSAVVFVRILNLNIHPTCFAARGAVCCVFLYKLHTQFFTPHVLQQEQLSAVCFCMNCTPNSSPHMFCSKRSCLLCAFVQIAHPILHPTCFAARGAVRFDCLYIPI